MGEKVLERELLCTGILGGRGWGALHAFRALRTFKAFMTFNSIVDIPAQLGYIVGG